MKMTVKLADLKLADVIRCGNPDGDEDFDTGIVKQITKTEVTIYRPYGVTGDYSYTGGVPCYMGVEEYRIPLSGHFLDKEFLVYRRSDLK